jgi:alkylhydroperoxidase family enzyme
MDGVSPRLVKLLPPALDDEQRAVYDAIVGGPRAQGPRPSSLTDDDGGLIGPFNAFLLQPRLGQPLQELGAAVRFQTSLSDRAREVAILVVAAARESSFEWYAHAAIGRRAGLTDDELAAIRENRPDRLTDDVERMVGETAYALVTWGDLDDDQYERVVAALGRPTLFEVLTLVGYYSLIALQLRVFRVEAPSG